MTDLRHTNFDFMSLMTHSGRVDESQKGKKCIEEKIKVHKGMGVLMAYSNYLTISIISLTEYLCGRK